MVSNEVLRDVALSFLRRWRDNPEKGRSALASVIAGEWIQQLGKLSTGMEEPVAKAVECARIRWWR